MTKQQGPVLIDLDDPAPNPRPKRTKAAKKPNGPDTAPPVPEVAQGAEIQPTGQAMQSMARLATRRSSILARWFWRLGIAIFTFALSVWAWEFVNSLIARNVYLGYAFTALIVVFLLVCLGMVLREWAAFSRLKRIDTIRNAAGDALTADDLVAARRVGEQMLALYSGRVDVEWGATRLREQTADIFDAEGHLALVETELLTPLDEQATAQVEAAARQVATVTAIVPIAFADVAAALVANLRMIRRIAEIYGGRAGTFGSWRLGRSVLGHLVATGAVAVGDDLITSVAGGGILSKLSRRFGEGIINGALTARVGVAAMEVCRPLPFRARLRPGVTGLIKRALAGLFSSK